MTGSRVVAAPTEVGVPGGACPFAAGQAPRRRSSALTSSRRVWRDARLAGIYAPDLAKGLALGAAGKARSRLVGRTVRRDVQLTDFDPLDPATAADPYPHYRELLAGERVRYNAKRNVYILSRYDDVRDAARDHRALSSARGITFSRLCLPFLPTSDPPEHTRMRKQMAPSFAPAALKSWRPIVDRAAEELVGALVPGAPVDVVSAVAAPMPMRTITEILGISSRDQAAFCRLSSQIVQITDVNLTASGLMSIVQSYTGFRRLYQLFTEALRDGARLDEHSVLGRLALHAEHGRLSDEELFFQAMLLLVAGYETTANLIGTLFLTLAEHPDQFRLLAQRPELIPWAIEEQLRFSTPIQNICRTTRFDYVVGSTVIPAGSLVLLAWGAANRDPHHWEEPDVFRVDREPAGHVAFGFGAHSCPGAQLARMEGQAVLRQIVDRMARIDVVEPPVWSTNSNLRGLKRLRVNVTGRSTDA